MTTAPFQLPTPISPSAALPMDANLKQLVHNVLMERARRAGQQPPALSSPATLAPPPYAPEDDIYGADEEGSCWDSEDSDEDEDDEQEPPPKNENLKSIQPDHLSNLITNQATSADKNEEPSLPPLKLTIDAEQVIQGNNNLVPINHRPSALDAVKISAIVMQTLQRWNESSSSPSSSSNLQIRRRGSAAQLNVHVRINCGLTVVGDRNIVGPVALRPRTPNATARDDSADSPVAANPPPAAVASGVKRRADEADLCVGTTDAAAQPSAKICKVDGGLNTPPPSA